MALTVSDFRLSFVWACALLPEKVPQAAASFATRTAYESLFDKLQAAPSADFDLPWPADYPYAHKFWVQYLSIQDPGLATGAMAWPKAVPLRAATRPVTAQASWFPGRVVLELYVFPFGVGIVASLNGSGDRAAADWVTLARGTADKPMSVAFGADPATDMVLKSAAAEGLTWAAKSYFGIAGLPTALLDPFVIATVVRGAGADKTVAPETNKDIHRILYGAATLRSNWDSATLDDLVKGKTLLDIRRGASPGDVVFAERRGRCVWIPSSFASTDPGVTSLSCYHRNQVFGALQVESLGGLARAVMTRVKTNRTQPVRVDQFGRMAASLLAELYRGDAGTYRSISLQRQIDDRDSRDDIVALGKRYGLPNTI